MSCLGGKRTLPPLPIAYVDDASCLLSLRPALAPLRMFLECDRLHERQLVTLTEEPRVCEKR